MSLKMADVSVLDVLLYEEPIGTLTGLPGDRTLFAFNDRYIEDENRHVLGLHFKDIYGELRTDFRPTQARLMPFFSNLLPEGHMRTYLAERARVNPAREFFLLWALGRDLPGAIVVKPAGGDDWPAEANEDFDSEPDQQMRDEMALRFSLAGVQIKFSAVNETTGGLTIPAQGIGGSWIVKLPSREFEGVPENEYSMMTLARLIGMNVPAIDLVEPSDIENLPQGVEGLNGKAFVIERFDRLSDGSLVQVEDFAQIFGVYPEQKYGKASMRNIATVLASETSNDDIAEFIRRLVFNTLIGNDDMHLKNWSVFYPDRRNAALSPAYDFVSTIPYIPGDKAALKFSRTKRFDGFSEDELSHLAAKAHLPETLVLDTARETVELFRQYWKTEKQNLPLTQQIINVIEAHIATVPLAQAGHRRSRPRPRLNM
jgi:serine/threonine-protein kinase HipA